MSTYLHLYDAMKVASSITKKGFFFLSVFLATLPTLLFSNSLIATPAQAQDINQYATEFAEMAAETARHFGGSVAAYEVWNEPDGHSAASIYLSPENYAPLLKAAYDAIKANSSSQVIVGGLLGDRNYLESLFQLSDGNLPADAIGIHPYVIDLDGLRGFVQSYKSISRGKPLWVTEFGWEVANQQQQADYLANGFGIFGEEGVPVTAWFCWSDTSSGRFGLVNTRGNPKRSYYAFPKGGGINIDPLRANGAPTASQLQDLGAGWVRMVYRPKTGYDFDGLIQSYRAVGAQIILVLNQETIWTTNLPVADGYSSCQPINGDWTRISSSTAPVPNSLQEKDSGTCKANGLLGFFRCLAEAFKDWVTGHLVPNSLRYENARGPRSLFSAHQYALSALDGALMRMLPPEYTIPGDGRDPLESLEEAKGETVLMKIIPNEGQATALTEGSGDYTLERYSTEASLPDVKPIFDSFAVLRYGFSPGAPEFTLPAANCEYGGQIQIMSPPESVTWKVNKVEGEVDCSPVDPTDPDCDDDPKTYQDGNCPCRGNLEGTAAGALKHRTNAAYTYEAWCAMAGPGGGALASILPPGYDFVRTDSNEATVGLTYNSQSTGSISTQHKLPIPDVGNVGNALDCVTKQLLNTPLNASTNVCEGATVALTKEAKSTRFCTPVDEDLGHECSMDHDYEISPSCTLAVDRFCELPILICWGNSCRNTDCATSPNVPGPKGACGSGWTAPGASAGNEGGIWFLSAGEFPNGEITYSGQTFAVPPGGVFICDSNTFACNNPVCRTGEWDFLEDDEAQAAAQPTTRTVEHAVNHSFFARLGSAVGGLIRTLLNL